MKRLLLCLVILTGTLSVMAQKYGSWHSSVTGRDYGVLAENIKGKSFDCFIYGQSLNKHIPIVGMRLSSKHIPAFVKELRSLADKAGLWWDTKAPVTGIEDAAVLFDTNFKNVTAWFDIGTPPEPEYHNMKDAHVAIVDKDKNRHPGFILPFGSKKEIEALITAIESLNPSVEEAYCIFCDVNLKTGEAHKQNCPYALDTEENDSSPSSQSTQSVQHPHEIHITCPQCGAVFSGKSASLAFKNGRNHKEDCPIFNKVPDVPQVPKIQ